MKKVLAKIRMQELSHAAIKINTVRKELTKIREKTLGTGSERKTIRELVPKSIIYTGENSAVYDAEKLKRINRLTEEIVKLQVELEQWTEKN